MWAWIVENLPVLAVGAAVGKIVRVPFVDKFIFEKWDALLARFRGG